jgi:hypothetical protein
MSFFNTPSLASATATRVDSACKHIQQCRVSYDHMIDFVGSASELERNKMQYCVHKDEMTVGVGRPWAKDLHLKIPPGAYPKVVSNMGRIALDTAYDPALKMIKYLYHFSTSIQKRQEIIDRMKTNPNTIQHVPAGAQTPYFHDANHAPLNLKPVLSKMYDFYPVGYANTLGYAHPNSGDTMTSVMIGGLRTVMNGDFEIFAGDIIQWYWTFERDCFHNDGSRKCITNAAGVVCDGNDPKIDYNNMAPPCAPGAPAPPAVDPHQRARRHYNDYQYSVDTDKKGPADKARHVARIKPYIRDDAQPRVYDWMRVFTFAISSARPNEMVDIKIGRQSM